MSIADNLITLMEINDLNQDAFARKIGITQSMVSQYLSGSKYPGKQTQKKILEIFHLQPNDILSDDEGLAAKKRENIAISNSTVINSLNSNVHNTSFVSTIKQTNSSASTNQGEQDYPNSFTLHVADNHMNKIIPPGYDVIIDPEQEPMNNMIVAVHAKDSNTISLRRLIKGNTTCILVSESTEQYPDILLTKDAGIDIIGVVICSRRIFKEK